MGPGLLPELGRKGDQQARGREHTRPTSRAGPLLLPELVQPLPQLVMSLALIGLADRIGRRGILCGDGPHRR
jgi:hypothetical protein